MKVYKTAPYTILNMNNSSKKIKKTWQAYILLVDTFAKTLLGIMPYISKTLLICYLFLTHRNYLKTIDNWKGKCPGVLVPYGHSTQHLAVTVRWGSTEVGANDAQSLLFCYRRPNYTNRRLQSLLLYLYYLLILMGTELRGTGSDSGI